MHNKKYCAVLLLLFKYKNDGIAFVWGRWYVNLQYKFG